MIMLKIFPNWRSVKLAHLLAIDELKHRGLLPHYHICGEDTAKQVKGHRWKCEVDHNRGSIRIGSKPPILKINYRGWMCPEHETPR